MTTENKASPVNDSKVTLPVVEFKAMLEAGVPIEFVRKTKERFAYRHFTPDAPDHQETAEPDALYYFNFMWEFLPSVIVPASKTTFDLPRELDPSFDDVTFSDIEGKDHPTLKGFIDAPDSKLQAVKMIHKGKVVYENYPGMRPSDKHLWMSCTKPLPGTLVLDLIVAGKMDPKASSTEYFAASIAKNVYRFTTVRVESAADAARWHGVNERVLVEEYANSIRFFHNFIANAEEV